MQFHENVCFQKHDRNVPPESEKQNTEKNIIEKYA